ncbi:hypothetical protein GGE67_005418 [Rhizobium leucaenae]|nr:hypothetical protein [Rhizobium leucaenae]
MALETFSCVYSAAIAVLTAQWISCKGMRDQECARYMGSDIGSLHLTKVSSPSGTRWLDLTHIPQFTIQPESIESKSFFQDDWDELSQLVDGAEADHLTQSNELDNINATLAAFEV